LFIELYYALFLFLLKICIIIQWYICSVFWKKWRSVLCITWLCRSSFVINFFVTLRKFNHLKIYLIQTNFGFIVCYDIDNVDIEVISIQKLINIDCWKLIEILVLTLKENETNCWFVVLQNLELIKKWKYDVFNENSTRADVKARLY
jgi:hypothetical protein